MVAPYNTAVPVIGTFAVSSPLLSSPLSGRVLFPRRGARNGPRRKKNRRPRDYKILYLRSGIWVGFSTFEPRAPGHAQRVKTGRMAPSLSVLFCVAALGSLLAEVSVGGSAGGSSRGALPLSRRKNGRRLHHVAPPAQSATRVVELRGGSTAAGEEREAEPGVVRSIRVQVSTTKISSFVDAVREMQVCDQGRHSSLHVCV